ncbi:MAG: tetratricopeptide repeat protein, partial [Planctomycetota bacterium]
MNAKALQELATKAHAGNLDAQCNLADHYLNQETDEGNHLAIPWLRKAAKQGERWAQYQLGYAYQEGLGVPRSKRHAIRFYKLSASQ